MSDSEIPVTHIEFMQAHATELAAHATRRDAELARALVIRAAALDGYASVAASANADHAAEAERRIVKFQRWAAGQLAEPVAVFEGNPTRPGASAIAGAFEQVDAQANIQLNPGDAPKVLSDSIVHAFIAQHAKSNPEGLSRLTGAQNWAEQVWGMPSIGGAAARALDALRRKSAGECLARLEALEAEIGRVGSPRSGAPSHAGDPAERFEVMRFGGSPTATATAIQRIEKSAFAKRNGTHEEIALRARQYEAGIKRPAKLLSISDVVTNLLFGDHDNPGALPVAAAQAAANEAHQKAVDRMPDAPVPAVTPVAFV